MHISRGRSYVQPYRGLLLLTLRVFVDLAGDMLNVTRSVVVWVQLQTMLASRHLHF
jgi:hypothetical protein